MAKAEIFEHRNRKYVAVETLFRETHVIKQVPGARYSAKQKRWLLPATYTACVQLAKVFAGHKIEVDDAIKTLSREGYERSQQVASAKDAPGAPLKVKGGELLPLQTTGVEFLKAAGSALMADDMGAGKTVMTSALLQMEMSPDGMSLVVCPKSVKPSWKKHIEHWTDFTPFVVDGGVKTREKIIAEAKSTPGAVLIMNWDLLKSHSRLKGYGNIRLSDKEKVDKDLNDVKFDYIIADEAHRMKSPKSKWTRAIWKLDAEHRIALTGTPIGNHPGDLWALLHFIAPDEFPSKGAYVERYCATRYSPFGGMDITGLEPENQQEFYHLLDSMFIRRTKQEIMDRKIEVSNIERHVTLPPKHRKVYKAMRDDLIAKIDGGFVSAVNPLVAAQRLIQLASAPLEQLETPEGEPERFVMTNPSPKVAEMLAILSDIGDEQVIVFSGSKQLLHLAKDALDKHNNSKAGKRDPYSYSFVTGDVTGIAREVEIEKFQQGQRKVFLATTQSVSEGVTLTAATVMIFLNRTWSMIENRQAEDRNNRVGQTADNITIIDIIATDTIDERTHEVFGDKTAKLDEITRDSLKEML